MNPQQPSKNTLQKSAIQRKFNKWNLAAAAILLGGHLLVFVAGIIYAAVLILPNPVTGDQAGWNVLAFIILPFGLLNIGYASIFSITAAAVSIVGIVKKGNSTISTVLLVFSLLMSLKFIDLIRHFL